MNKRTYTEQQYQSGVAQHHYFYHAYCTYSNMEDDMM